MQLAVASLHERLCQETCDQIVETLHLAACE